MAAPPAAPASLQISAFRSERRLFRRTSVVQVIDPTNLPSSLRRRAAPRPPDPQLLHPFRRRRGHLRLDKFKDAGEEQAPGA